MCGGANYGRDCDSIASMAGAIGGALRGDRVIRPAWIARVDEANRVDLGALAAGLVGVTRHLQQRQMAEAMERAHAFAHLDAPMGEAATMNGGAPPAARVESWL